jgi:16S rRNA (uracil1498-N3)-methyltransferase
MHRFFIPAPPPNTENLTLTGEDARHAALSLRLTKNERFVCCDGNRCDYIVSVQHISRDTVECRIVDTLPTPGEPDYHITLLQCLPKGDRFDYIIQKAVELGVTRILPVISQRTVARPDAAAAGKRLLRWRKLAKEAAMQSGRGIVPEVTALLPFVQALALIFENDSFNMMCWEEGGALLSKLYASFRERTALSAPKKLSVFIGPEGGISEAEVMQFKARGGVICSLGSLILRTDTAPVAALSILGELLRCSCSI